MSALIHLSERWSIVGISTLRYSRGTPLTAILKTMQERFTVPPARAIGVASVVRWKQHRANGALSPRSNHKQTRQVTFPEAHLTNRS
jgi:hypothetical protein